MRLEDLEDGFEEVSIPSAAPWTDQLIYSDHIAAKVKRNLQKFDQHCLQLYENLRWDIGKDEESQQDNDSWDSGSHSTQSFEADGLLSAYSEESQCGKPSLRLNFYGNHLFLRCWADLMRVDESAQDALLPHLLNQNRKKILSNLAEIENKYKLVWRDRDWDQKLSEDFLIKQVPDSFGKYLVMSSKLAILSNATKSIVVKPPDESTSFVQMLVWGGYYILVPENKLWMVYDQDLKQVPLDWIGKTPTTRSRSSAYFYSTCIQTTEKNVLFLHGDSWDSYTQITTVDNEMRLSMSEPRPNTRIHRLQVCPQTEQHTLLVEIEGVFYLERNDLRVKLKHTDYDGALVYEFKQTYTGSVVMVEDRYYDSDSTLTYFNKKSLKPLEICDLTYKRAIVRLLTPHREIFPLMLITQGKSRIQMFAEFRDKFYRLGELFPTEPIRPGTKLSHVGVNIWTYLDRENKMWAMVIQMKTLIDKWICK